MNYRDRSPNRMNQGPRFRQDFRPGFGRGRINDRTPNIEDRQRPMWKDDRFDNRNSGGFRPSGPPVGIHDVRETPKDFVPGPGRLLPERDLRPPSLNARGPPETTKWNEPPKSQPGGPIISPTVNAVRTNDVEIIVTHKTLTEYAEFIERRLKTVGLSVDLLFPNEEVPLGRVLANIASRGTLYALVVTQLSEEHRSVTVNVLYSQTQEHRNMPLDDAIALIVKLFDAYMKGERCPILPPVGAVPITPAGIPLGEKHPEAIQTLLNILVENRSLTAFQYDKIISYFQEKKEQQAKLELGDDTLPQNTKTILQNRILNILSSSDNKLGDKSAALLPPTQQPNPSLLKDSTTLKALQNIVQNNFLHGTVGNYGKPMGPRM